MSPPRTYDDLGKKNGRYDMDRVGLFSEMPYLNGGPYLRKKRLCIILLKITWSKAKSRYVQHCGFRFNGRFKAQILSGRNTIISVALSLTVGDIRVSKSHRFSNEKYFPAMYKISRSRYRV